MRRWLLLLVACSSSGGGKDACTRAFDKLASLGMYGGEDYGALDAIALGTACRDLGREDFACIDAATSKADVDSCTSFVSASSAAKSALYGSREDDATPADVNDVRDLADAVCACKEVSCLVGVGEKQRAKIREIVSGGEPKDPEGAKAVDRMEDCVKHLGHGAPSKSDDALAGQVRFFADQMCACTTADCAKAVDETMSTWEVTVDQHTKHDESTMQRVRLQMERMTSCKARLSASP